MAEKKIKRDFAQLHQFLRDEEEARLSVLRQEAERASTVTERELRIVRGQMHVLTEAISRLEKDMKKDDYTFFRVKNPLLPLASALNLHLHLTTLYQFTNPLVSNQWHAQMRLGMMT